jgi:hypothetical protein
MIYTFIRSHEKITLIEKMCKVLQVGQRSYYHWKSQCISKRKQRVLLVKEKITSIYYASKQRYGNPRITAELSSLGTKSSRITIQDFPLRSKFVYLHIKRRRCTYKESQEIIQCDWNIIAQGTRMNQ